jgi:glutamate 5-kinase
VRYDRAELGQILGVSTERIRETLGLETADPVIHRNDLLLT